MIRSTFRAMGTKVDVVATDAARFEATVALFTELEQRFSRFLPESELSRVNRDPAGRVGVSNEMAEVLALATDLAGRTGGLVDPAVGALVERWGYDRSFELVGDLSAEPEEYRVGSWAIEGTTLVRPPGTTLDLGGIVKGWAADRAVETGRALLVSAGGDVRSSLTDALVEVENPVDGSTTTVHLGTGALATSSVARRRWAAGGRVVHHLIDPRSAAPAVTPTLSASARCATAAECEAAAKAVLILGAGGLAWADEQDWIDSALVAWVDGSVFATTGWKVAA